jgi:hypothetical protein
MLMDTICCFVGSGFKTANTVIDRFLVGCNTFNEEGDSEIIESSAKDSDRPVFGWVQHVQ